MTSSVLLPLTVAAEQAALAALILVERTWEIFSGIYSEISLAEEEAAPVTMGHLEEQILEPASA